MVSTIFERHVNTTETLIPAEGEGPLVLAKPAAGDTGRIDFDTIRAFRLRSGNAVVPDAGTRLFAPLVKAGSVKTRVIFEEDTPDNDLFMRNVSEEEDIRFIVTGA